MTTEQKPVLSPLERHAVDFSTLETIYQKLELLAQYIVDNRQDCLDTTQPILNMVGSSLRDLINLVQERGDKVKSEYEKLDIMEEAAQRLEQRLHRNKK